MIAGKIQNWKKTLFPKSSSRRYRENSHQRTENPVAVVEHLENRILLTVVDNDDSYHDNDHYEYFKKAIDHWSSHIKSVIPESYLSKISNKITEAISEYQHEIEKLPEPASQIVEHIQKYVIPELNSPSSSYDHSEYNNEENESDDSSYSSSPLSTIASTVKDKIDEALSKASSYSDEISKKFNYQSEPEENHSSSHHKMTGYDNSHQPEMEYTSTDHHSSSDEYSEPLKQKIGNKIHSEISKYEDKIENTIYKIKEAKHKYFDEVKETITKEISSHIPAKNPQYQQPEYQQSNENHQPKHETPNIISYLSSQYSKEIDQFFKYFPHLNYDYSNHGESDWVDESKEQGNNILDKKTSGSDHKGMTSYNHDFDYDYKELKYSAGGLFDKIKSLF
jgi:hypothetical protein